MATDRPVVAAAALACVLGTALGLGGCTVAGSSGRGINNLATTGLAYTHVVRPLMTNFDQTPVANDRARNDVKTITVQNFDVAWGKEGLGAIALEKGIAEIYSADIETTRYLGVFKRERVIIHGRAVNAPAPPGASAPFDEDTGQ
jgi:hypothetical protein